jgi:hypothetical protein
MVWSLDFCLSCDRQISQSENGAYCSQSCHLADLERASTGPASPASYVSSSSAHSQTTPPPSAGFYLPPALSFTSSMSSTRQFSSSSPYSAPALRSPISSHHPHHHSFTPTALTSPRSFDERKPKLYNSPSRSSLSSLNSSGHSDTSSSSSTGMSEKVKNELREYAGSFDHIRDWKRRMTVV